MRCTYCQGTKFFEGPSGGLSVNVLCANPDCRHWFNDLGPLGFEDLHRVESTDEEKKREAAQRREAARIARDARFEEGAACFVAGRDTQTLRSDGAYGGYAERESNVDRLVGYLRALEKTRIPR